MGEVAVVSLGDILYDGDGVSDGNVMAKEACKMKAWSAFWYVVMVRCTGVPGILTVSPSTHDGNVGWVLVREISSDQSTCRLHITRR